MILLYSIAFPGGMSDPTDRDSIHTAEREAFEEIGLEPHQYSIVGCLLPITDSRLVIITPVVALIHSPKFVDFRLSIDEATDAFYVDLEQFLYSNQNYKILLATLVYQQIPQFPVFRHEQYLDLKQILKQQKDFFRMCVDLRYRDKTKQDKKEKSQL
jgi:8-oxo-dGTP pyrophosphatase MutT (NUDIX family)